jgi:hypothetical protein
MSSSLAEAAGIDMDERFEKDGEERARSPILEPTRGPLLGRCGFLRCVLVADKDVGLTAPRIGAGLHSPIGVC